MQPETTKLVRGWAIVVGLIGLIPIFNLSSYTVTSGIGIISIISVVLALAILTAGIGINNFSVSIVRGIFWAELAYLIIDFLYLIISGNANIIRLFIVVIEAIIILVLIRKIK